MKTNMIKNHSITLTFLILFLSATILFGQETTYKTTSPDMELTFRILNKDKGHIAKLESMINTQTGRCYTKQTEGFFILQIKDKAGKIINLNPAVPWKSITVKEKTEGEKKILSMTFRDPVVLGDKATITITIRIESNQHESGFKFYWHGDNSNGQYRWVLGTFPRIAFQGFNENMKLLVPSLSGEVYENVCNKPFKYGGAYPDGFAATMGLMALWGDDSQQGIYLANEDPNGNRKWFSAVGEPKANQIVISFRSAIDNPTLSFEGKGTVVVKPFNGDWYDAAILYRNWARKNAKWYPEMGPNGRVDTPLWMKENCVFLLASTDPRWLTPNRTVYTPLNKMAESMHAFRDAVGVPGAVHWYLWHQNPYDNDYPHFFPAKEGFAEEVLKVQKDGNWRVMPYINGRLWDTHDRGNEDWMFTKEGRAGASKREDGSIITETYALKNTGREADGTPCVHAVMCPASDVWAKKLRHNVLTAMNGHNVQCVYLDQIGAAQPVPCCDPNHHHPAGYGNWWLSEGYWKILSKIREDMRKEVPDYPLNPELKKMVANNPQLLKDRIICTECNSEVYAKFVDGFLNWHWQNTRQVPAFSVIYGGTVCMFGRCSTGNALSVKMRVCEALTFGEQIGWFDASVRNNPEMFPFIRNAIRLRYQIRKYFYLGEMARPPKFIDPMQKTTAEWLWGGNPNVNTKNSVQTSIWRILDYHEKLKGNEKTNSIALIFSNVSDKDLTNRLAFNKKELGLDHGTFKVRKINGDGIESDNLPLSILDEPIDFPAGKSWAFEIVRTEN